MNVNYYKLATAVLLCTTILAGVLALQYNLQLQETERENDILLHELKENTITISVKINYGNETIKWYNDTRIPLGTSLLNATGRVSELELKDYGWGVFVVSINGIGGNDNKFWIWHYYDEGWQMGPVGSGQWTLNDGDILSWTLTSF